LFPVVYGLEKMLTVAINGALNDGAKIMTTQAVIPVSTTDQGHNLERLRQA
jgi:hypothetical protein